MSWSYISVVPQSKNAVCANKTYYQILPLNIKIQVNPLPCYNKVECTLWLILNTPFSCDIGRLLISAEIFLSKKHCVSSKMHTSSFFFFFYFFLDVYLLITSHWNTRKLSQILHLGLVHFKIFRACQSYLLSSEEPVILLKFKHCQSVLRSGNPLKEKTNLSWILIYFWFLNCTGTDIGVIHWIVWFSHHAQYLWVYKCPF